MFSELLGLSSTVRMVMAGIVIALVVAIGASVGMNLHQAKELGKTEASLSEARGVNAANVAEIERLKAETYKAEQAISADATTTITRTEFVDRIKEVIRHAPAPPPNCPSVSPRIRAVLDELRSGPRAGPVPGRAGDAPRPVADLPVGSGRP